jgi:hypothetical protein
MFDLEHNILLTETYFKNAERQENGEWMYSIQCCVDDFQNAFPNFPVEYPKLVQTTFDILITLDRHNLNFDMGETVIQLVSKHRF